MWKLCFCFYNSTNALHCIYRHRKSNESFFVSYGAQQYYKNAIQIQPKTSRNLIGRKTIVEVPKLYHTKPSRHQTIGTRERTYRRNKMKRGKGQHCYQQLGCSCAKSPIHEVSFDISGLRFRPAGLMWHSGVPQPFHELIAICSKLFMASQQCTL